MKPDEEAAVDRQLRLMKRRLRPAGLERYLESASMLIPSISKKLPLLGLTAVLAAAGMPGVGQAQTAPPPNTVQLEQKSEMLERALTDEEQRLLKLQSEYQELQIQIRTLGGHPGPMTSALGQPGQGQTVQGGQTTSGTGTSVPSVQASSGSRKTPGQSAAVEAAYQQQNALFRPGLTFFPQFQYSYTNSRNLVLNGFLAFDAILLGNINVSRIETNVFQWNPQVYYAFNRHFELNVNFPYFFEQSTFKEIGASNSTAKESQATVNKWGLGDISGGFYWQVADQHDWWPSIIWNVQASAPTGTSPYGIKLLRDPTNTNLMFPNNLPTGKGVWGISSGFSVIRQLDPVVVFGSGNFYYEFTQNVKDISAVAGTVTSGEVAPGNALSYTLGASLALNERFSTLVEIQDIITNSTELKANNGGSWTTVPDSDSNAAQFIFGATYAASRNLFPFVQAGIGATQYAPNFQISLWVPYYFSF
jgi:hypothetical protein